MFFIKRTYFCVQAKLAKPMKAERHSIMRKIINGRKYDTETAECVGEMASTYNFNDGYYYWEELYRKRTGEFFLHGAGNGLSPYAQSVGMGSTSGERCDTFVTEKVTHKSANNRIGI